MADWTEQAEQMLKTWTEAQKNVWDSWQELADRAGGARQPKPQPFSMNPMEWFQQSMSGWMDSSGVAQDTGRQVFGSQFSMMRNLELLTRAWQMIAPKLDAGQDWRPSLAGFTTNWFRQITGASGGMLEMTKDTQALWQSFMNEWGPLLKPLASSMIEATGGGHLGEMMLGKSEGLSRMFMIGKDGFQTVPFADLADIPSVGVTREHQVKVLRTFDAFVDLRKVLFKYNKMTIGGLNKAVETVMETLVEKGKKGEKISSVRELNRLWLDSADKVFTEMYASGEYLKVQAELSKTGMTFRILQHELVEVMLKNMNLPTRSELDDAYKTLYELRKEVKALKKTVREQAARQPEKAQTVPRAKEEEDATATGDAIKKQVETKKATKKTPVRKKTTPPANPVA